MPKGPQGQKRPAARHNRQDRDRRDQGRDHGGRQERRRRGLGAHGREGTGSWHEQKEAKGDRPQSR